MPAIVYIATSHVGKEPIWAYQLQYAVETHTRSRLDLGPLGLGQFDISQAFDCERLYLLLPPRLKQLQLLQLQAQMEQIIGQLQPQPWPVQGEMLDWQDIRALQESGVQIGAHTRHHVLSLIHI